MLLLASRARKRYAPAARLVYECLDIHRLLLSTRFDGALLRFLETRLWDEVDLLLTSSPAFVRNYFAPRRFCGPSQNCRKQGSAIGGRSTAAFLL